MQAGHVIVPIGEWEKDPGTLAPWAYFLGFKNLFVISFLTKDSLSIVMNFFSFAVVSLGLRCPPPSVLQTYF